MQPTAKDARIDTLLSNVSIRYRNLLYIGEQVMPVVRVDKQSGKYRTFPLGEWFRNEAQLRAPGTPSEGGGFPLSSDSFDCKERAYHTILEDEVRDNADAVLRMETAKTEFVTEKILIWLEKTIADLCFTAANWGSSTTLSGTNQWSDYDNSDPVANLETGIDTIEDATGQIVNTVVIGKAVWRKLKHHPQLLDRLPVTGTKTATLDTLKALLSQDGRSNMNILVGTALYNNAKRGASDSLTQIWGKHVWMGHVAPSPALDTPSAGYHFVWPRDGGQMRGVRRWRYEDGHADKIEAFMNADAKVTGSDLGYVIRDAVA